MQRIFVFIILSAAVFVVGCATERSLGDRMIDQSKQTKSIGKDWKQGQELVKKGEKLRARSEKQIEYGRADLAKAEKQIRKGRELIQSSEAVFQARLSSDNF